MQLFQFCCRIMTKQVIPLCSNVDYVSSIFTCSRSIVSVTCLWMKSLQSLLSSYILSIFISLQLFPPFLVLPVPCCTICFFVISSFFHLKCYSLYFECPFPIYSFIMTNFFSKTLFLMLSHHIFCLTTSKKLYVLGHAGACVHVQLLYVKFSLI